MACFQRDLPESMKQLPIIGRYAKLYGWLIFALSAVWYCRPEKWGGYDEAVGFLLVGVYCLVWCAAILTCFMWSGDQSSRLYASVASSMSILPSPSQTVTFASVRRCGQQPCSHHLLRYDQRHAARSSGQAMDLFSGFRSIMAGASGTIMHLGIGPIVTGSIIMQLFAVRRSSV